MCFLLTGLGSLLNFRNDRPAAQTPHRYGAHFKSSLFQTKLC
jgi:hypothetical protein